MQRHDRERELRDLREREYEQRRPATRSAYRPDDSRNAQSYRDMEDSSSYLDAERWREAYASDEDETYRSDFARQRYGRGHEVRLGRQDYDEERGNLRPSYDAARDYGNAGYRQRSAYDDDTRAGWSNEATRQSYSSADRYRPREPSYTQRPYPSQSVGVPDYDRSGQGYVGAYGADLGYSARPQRPERSQFPASHEERGRTQGSVYGYGTRAYGEDAYGREFGNASEVRNDLRGRGPKNYLRSDERIQEDLCERLADDPYIDASEITVTVKNGVATLTGSVDQRHLKHRAEDIADHCSGVKDVENRLTVQSQLNRASTTAATGSAAAAPRIDDIQKKH